MSTIKEEGLFSSVEEENKKSDGPNDQSTKFEVVTLINFTTLLYIPNHFKIYYLQFLDQLVSR